MASVDLQEKENFIRLVRLLVDKGTEALRNTLDTIHTPVSLPVVLNANRPSLSKLKPLVINDSLWDLLFPPSGNPPDSKTFDMILLTILLRNICGLHPPATGWNKMPPSTNNSLEANITRIKLFKNQVYGHFPTAMVDEKTFEDLWQAISRALVYLNIPQQEIDDLKICPLRPEEEKYLRLLKIIKQEDQGNTEKDDKESWKWKQKSTVHGEKFEKLLEFGKQKPNKVKEISGIRVCCSQDFLIGIGAGGTAVFVGLGKDGIERAVKRLPKLNCTSVAQQEMKVLTKPNATDANNVVKYWFLDESSDEDHLFLILDLCEETLESYVRHESADDLATVAPEIIQQILKGLADLHRGPNPILHRDLKPSNILRDVNGKWLLADFGISRVMETNETSYESGQRGTKHWRAVETYPSKDTSDDGQVRYRKESDIQVAGMIAYYIRTKGEHAFGKERNQLNNLLDGQPVGLEKLKDPALKDLLTWMLSHDPKDRPSAEEALKHPYLQPQEQQFELLCNMGNQPEIKNGDGSSIAVQQLNSDSTDWQTLMDADVLKYLCTDFLNGKPRTYNYGSSWTECLRLIRNINQHWKDRPRPKPQPEAFYLVGDPQEYFLKIFPYLPVTVHRIVRSCDWKERPELQKYFSGEVQDKKRPTIKDNKLVSVEWIYTSNIHNS